MLDAKTQLPKWSNPTYVREWRTTSATDDRCDTGVPDSARPHNKTTTRVSFRFAISAGCRVPAAGVNDKGSRVHTDSAAVHDMRASKFAVSSMHACFSLTVSKSTEHPHPSLHRGGTGIGSGGRAQSFPCPPVAAFSPPPPLLDPRKQCVEERQLAQAHVGAMQKKAADNVTKGRRRG